MKSWSYSGGDYAVVVRGDRFISQCRAAALNITPWLLCHWQLSCPSSSYGILVRSSQSDISIAVESGGLDLCTGQGSLQPIARLCSASIGLPSDVAARQYARSLPGFQAPGLG